MKAETQKTTTDPRLETGSTTTIAYEGASSVATQPDRQLSQALQPSASKRSFWLWFTGVSLVLIVIAGVRWILDHPYAVHADEAAYIDQVQLDVQRLVSGKVVRLAGRIMLGDRFRPPAYRILALPVLAITGFHTSTARFVSLGLMSISICFIYFTARRFATALAGAVAVLFFFLSPEIVSASTLFSTEAPLFFATSAMLYFLSPYWSKAELPRKWIGLGLAIGLGLLSKTSFLLVLLPVLGFTLFASRRRLTRPAVIALLKAAALAFVLSAPWWLANVHQALSYAKFAMDSPRNSLGKVGLDTWAKWGSTIMQGLLGYGLTIIILLLTIAVFHKIIVRHEHLFNLSQRTALMACACATLPLFVVQSTGVNHLLRYLTPALIPLAIMVGVLADHIGWTRRWQSVAGLAGCFALQLVMIITPVVFPNTQPVDPGFANGGLPWRVLIRFDQWNWKPVRDISRSCGLELPRISFLGNGRAFTPAHIDYAWIVEGARPPDVQWLWRYEDGPVNWERVWKSVDESDIVLTAPHYTGQVSDWQDRDNQYNTEFAAQLAQDPRFRQPIQLAMGRFEPVKILAFLNKDLVCR